MPAYAIGDIHGHLDKLDRAHALIEADRAREGWRAAPVVHIGDLVDRGPDSRGVIEFLRQGLVRGANWIVLKGNHDRMMRLFLNNPPEPDPRLRPEFTWTHPRLGGLETLASYGVEISPGRGAAALHRDALAAVPAEHIVFLDRLDLTWREGMAFYCHAGIRPGVALNEQVEDDLVWIRDEFHTDARDHGALIVHGHTPIDAVTHYGNRVNIDTGAGYGAAVSAVAIEDRDVWLLTRAGRVAVTPVQAGMP